MVITCVDNAFFDIHSCITTGKVFSWLLGPSGLIFFYVKTLMLKQGKTKVDNPLAKPFPYHRIHFWHIFENHKSENIRVCDDGKCKIVELK